MEQIAQLKAMRDAARARIEALPDWKLMKSLDALIPEMEQAFGVTSDTGAGERAATAPAEEEPSEEEPSQAPAIDEIAEFEAQTAVEQTPPAQPEVIAADGSQAQAEPQASPGAAEIDLAVEIEQSIEEMVLAGNGGFSVDRDNATDIADEPAQSNGEVAAADVSADAEEDAVSRALDELSNDLADATRTDSNTVFRFRN